MRRKQLAFTLIELLVVIAIVGILAGFVFVSMSGGIASAQDAKRKTDLSSIQKAIFMYQSAGGTLPAGSGCTIGATGCIGDPANNVLADYLKAIPIDSDASKHYTYTLNGSDFIIQATLSSGKTYSYSTVSGWSEAFNAYPGWTKRKTVTVSNSGSTLTDYQVKLSVTYDSDMQSDFDDLRFSTASGTILNYWIESYTASTSAVVWVKVPTIANPSTDITMYYGNGSAATPTESEEQTMGENTFIFFDDFPGTSYNTGKWTQSLTYGTIAVSGSVLTYTGSSSGQGELDSITAGSSGSAVRARIKTDHWQSTSYQEAFAYGWVFAGYSSNGGTNINGKYGYYSGGWVQLGSITGWSAGTWHIQDMMKNSSSEFAVKVDDANSASYSHSDSSYNARIHVINSSAKIYLDWVVVRKYTTTEPTSAFGSEQNNS
jgi:prepilin-type N-terminal cleavage/methylation domain-containing protein